MALSNSYEDTAREPGYVGLPLPGVSVCIADNTDNKYSAIVECSNKNKAVVFTSPVPLTDVQGELLVKSGGVFREYYNRPEATKKEFTEDGWFKTGDICQYVAEKKKMKMLGRTSVDIIKSGGYKISALEVETHLLSHEDINDCCVVGLPDQEWGEKVAAVIALKSGKELSLDELRKWAADKMPKYSVPTVLKVVEEIPKNNMGKVNKKELIKIAFTE